MLLRLLPWRGGQRHSELEQACVRIVFGSLLLFYFGYLQSDRTTDTSPIHIGILTALSVFLAASVAIAVSLMLWAGGSVIRRICTIALDVGTLTYLLLIGDRHSAPLYFLYLWIIIGNGFRFGRSYLFIALGLTLTGFGLVIFLVPYWREESELSIGLWIGTLLISIYFNLLVGRLFRALDEANVANAAKRQFICAVSHELRTPLNAMIGMIDLLKTKQMDREQQEMLDCMVTTSQMMLAQIDDVLDFSRIEAGKMTVEHLPFDLYELVHGILAVFRYRIDLRAIELRSWIGHEVPVMLSGDPHHLRQVLMNLLSNAVKFTEQGYVRLSVMLVDDSDPAQVRLLFSVVDTGIGIPDVVQGRIFESFTQADDSTARRYGGSGLGTTICKQLVELMGGRIGFSSQPGAGSEFWFELDFPRVPAEVHEVTAPGGCRSMIVGQGAESDRLVTMLTNDTGNAPMQARDAAEALRLAEQACLHGQAPGLLFIEVSADDVDHGAADSLAKLMRELRDAAANPCMATVLLPPPDLSLAQSTELALAAGCFSLLPADPDRQSVAHVRHWATLVNRDSEHQPVLGEAPALPATVLGSDPLRPEAVDGFDVLIVEDNPTNRRVLQKILERAGHRCVLARNGEEALDLIGRQVFDVIVLDMSMPGVHGIEVARVCRLMGGPASQVPIIMFSANVTPDAHEESLRAGASIFMPKPIQVGPFLQTLRDLVEGRFPSVGSSDTEPLIPAEREMALLVRDAPVLDIANLVALEAVSPDPAFLDELIDEYIEESRRLLRVLDQGLAEANGAQVREALHALRGSALSVGATALKLTCKRIEQLSQQELDERKTQIVRELNLAFSELLVELGKFQRHRDSSEAATPGSGANCSQS